MPTWSVHALTDMGREPQTGLGVLRELTLTPAPAAAAPLPDMLERAGCSDATLLHPLPLPARLTGAPAPSPLLRDTCGNTPGLRPGPLLFPDLILLPHDLIRGFKYLYTHMAPKRVSPALTSPLSSKLTCSTRQASPKGKTESSIYAPT